MNHLPILALTSDGAPHAWMSWENACVAKCKNLIGWELGNPDTIYGGTSRMTGQRSSIDVAPIISIKGKFKYKRNVPTLTNELLFARERGICGYCSRLIRDSKNITRDHIIPTSRGGKDTWTNVVLSCRSCNGHKDCRTPEEAGMELIFLPYVPDRNEELLMRNRRIIFDQMEFIAKFVKEDSRILDYVKTARGFDF